MGKTEHRVSVEGGKYTFVVPADDYRVSILRHGEPWHGPQSEASNALLQIMMELDAARVVVQAARDAVDAPTLRRKEFLQEALALHDRLTGDREPPSAWCGGGVDSEPTEPTASVDPPVSLDDLERRATRDAQRLDGLHGDPSRAGGWIGHRDYARALVLLIPRLRAAEFRVTALETRQQELLQTIVRVTNETPFPDEIKGWEAQRAAMVAEVGSLRARVTELERADSDHRHDAMERDL